MLAAVSKSSSTVAAPILGLLRWLCSALYRFLSCHWAPHEVSCLDFLLDAKIGIENKELLAVV